MEQVDGSETLAAKWPTALTYMSGDHIHLETELLIAYDNLAHAIQQALNLTRLNERPRLEILEYEKEANAVVNVTTESADPAPYMAEPIPLYHQKVLHSYEEHEEEYRKSF